MCQRFPPLWLEAWNYYQTGPLSYEVLLGNGQIWRCYINHVKGNLFYMAQNPLILLFWISHHGHRLIVRMFHQIRNRTKRIVATLNICGRQWSVILVNYISLLIVFLSLLLVFISFYQVEGNVMYAMIIISVCMVYCYSPISCPFPVL